MVCENMMPADAKMYAEMILNFIIVIRHSFRINGALKKASRVLAILSVLLFGLQAQNASFPLESVSLEGTAMPKDAILEIAGFHIGSPVDQAAIEAGCNRLKESGL